MNIFMDESGNFTHSFGVSAICSLSLPDKVLHGARRELKRVSETWPHHNGELKSGSVSREALSTLIDILYERDALLHCCAIDVSAHTEQEVSAHKQGQCEGITKYLTSEHEPELVASLWNYRRKLEKMSNQLYIQSVLMTVLVCVVAEEVAMYFSQRRPREIANFKWILDAKDPTRISSQELWWRDMVAPMAEAQSRRSPFGVGDGNEFNYKHFDRSYLMSKDQWYPDRPRERYVGFNIKKLISENISFLDSRSDILIQAADVLTGFIRKVLSGEITDERIILQLGRLQIRRRRNRSMLVSLGSSSESRHFRYAPLRILFQNSRSMLAK